MIEIKGLEKRFGNLEVLKGIDLAVRPGEVTAVVGPNAAGKTTLMKIILGLTKPDAGSVDVLGNRLNGDYAYREEIGYMAQIARFPDNITVAEALDLLGDLRGGFDYTSDELYGGFELATHRDKPLRTLSGGTRQKVSALVAFMFGPKILILDEPSAGMDPVSSSLLKDRIIHEKEAGRTILMTSHIMSEVDELADRFVYLMDGRVWIDRETQEIRSDLGEDRLERALARMLKAESA
jgi:Cu-processing system ATP-binding protein